MANPLPSDLITGTLGELFVQLRLLEYDIQAVAPLKDTGNDLIATKGKNARFIQIKSSGSGMPQTTRVNARIYDFLFRVHLKFEEDGQLLLDATEINVRDQNGVDLGPLTRELSDAIWA
ncbi:MAG: hypothetical protein COA96_15015 [SAR86 cluster bacterium]|uniref:PD(D/E)XK endonuclease domain-containing protein n=1 Tax=SAR86 cluster bacterium TaxID=2030880 RepID=A0A2A5AS05_9GAMM|nr:MAG: hypothetical protein COA96_15015 [SAR86 cluster bacterium]